MDAQSNNLPAQLTSFIGRERELAALDKALAATRLLTLAGAGGCGKTRLALRVAGGVRNSYPDGVWWVELGPLTDAAQVGDAVASAIGVRPFPGQASAESVIVHLATKRVLVVLDNCEHVLESCAELTETLLRACPRLTVLATSRAPLALPGEVDWRVPSMSLPVEGSAASAESLAHSDAVRLFVERAVRGRPSFALTSDNAAKVAEICRALDGIPLAIELAAARVRMLSVDQIAAGLGDRLRLLTSGERIAPRRQQTLGASVDWSYELLDESERVMLRRLGVFIGGFALDACVQVCADEGSDRYATLDLLTSLADQSLLAIEERGQSIRYRLLETVRHYALERLDEAGESELVRKRHRDAFVKLAERVEPDLFGERQPQALELLDAEAANLQAAIEFAAQSEPEEALRLCAALTCWWRYRGRFAAGEAAFQVALESHAGERSASRARTHWGRAYLAAGAGAHELGVESASEALAIAEELDDEWLQGRALDALALLYVFADPQAAAKFAERSRTLARAAGDEFTLADAHQILAGAHWFEDDYTACRRATDVSLEIAERLGNREIIAWSWLFRGITPWGSPDFGRRRAALTRAIAIAAEIGEPASESFGIAYVAILDVWTGAPAAAVGRLESCLERAVIAGAGWTMATVQWALGLAQASLGRLDEARATLLDVVERDADGFGWGLSAALSSLAGVERLSGAVAASAAHAARALELADEVGSDWLAAEARHQQGRLAAEGGGWADAGRLIHEALGALVEGEQRVFFPDALDGLAEVAGGFGRHAEAARLLASAARARSDLGIVRWSGEDERWEKLGRELQEALGADGYEAASAEGRALTLDEAVAYARRSRGSRKRPPGGWESLTPTEVEVVRHAGAGLTNPEIAKRMFISRASVKTHLAHVYAKLGVKNRSELAAEAARHEVRQRRKPEPIVRRSGSK